MWIILALLSAMFAASRRVTEKRMSAQANHYTLGWTTQLCALPVILVMTLAFGQLLNPFQLGIQFWLPLAILIMGFYPLNTFLYYQALKHGELSTMLPIMSLWPVLSILPAWAFLDEVPSLLGYIGIIATVAGVYVLGLKGRKLHRPWEPFVESKSSRYTLISVVILTAVGVLDKIAIQESNAMFFSLMNTVGALFILLLMAGMRAKGTVLPSRELWKPILLSGSLNGMNTITYMLALAAGPIAYVTAVRGSSSLIGAFLGIIMLGESFTKQKKLSFALIVLGSVLLAMGR